MSNPISMVMNIANDMVRKKHKMRGGYSFGDWFNDTFNNSRVPASQNVMNYLDPLSLGVAIFSNRDTSYDTLYAQQQADIGETTYDPEAVAAAEAKAAEELAIKNKAIVQGYREDAKAKTLAKAKASYNPAQAQLDMMNRQKIANANQSAYQQKQAKFNLAQMASTKNKALSTQNAMIQRQASESVADKSDYINGIKKAMSEQQNGESETTRLLRERTLQISSALRTRLGIQDAQRAEKKNILNNSAQILANQEAQQSYQQTELQKKQAAQALARQGIKSGSGRRKK